MGVLAARGFGELVPGFDRHLAVGFRRQHQDHLGGVDGGVELGQTLGRAFLGHHAVEVA